MAEPANPAWDDIDLRLLDLLQADADRTLRDLGELVGLSASAVQRRITRYKRHGMLRTVAVLDPRVAAPVVEAIVLVTLAEESPSTHGRLRERLVARPEVRQCYQVAGRWDYVVVLTAAGVRACRDLGDELFKSDANVRRYETLIVFDAPKAGTAIPADLLRHRA